MPRFFVEKITDPAVLSLRESKHALRSLRLAPGDRVTVFDPHESWAGEIQSAEGQVTIRLLKKLEAPKLPRVVVAAALPKGPRLDWMVEKLAEMGVAEFIPTRFSRSVAEPGEHKRLRLEKIAVAAAKQSGAPIMNIASERTVGELSPDTWLASPGAAESLPTDGGCVLIGPEGGLTREEEARFPRRLSLGPTILRIETAAIVAAARFFS